ncbi:transposase [Variovorax guangxiensis]|uniref:transposase n=1 Tax=Variovorax guangxiensis TaxID=1775474 RepID=UPI002861DA3B|nr:transposase [Variovorax guangxiensis]MDR6860516.1 hypothetical protein [Variovorax guangxiensis]
MSTTQTVPQGKDTAIAGDLYVSLELGDKSWKVTASDGHRSSPSRCNVAAGDTAAVVHCIGKAMRSVLARRACRFTSAGGVDHDVVDTLLAIGLKGAWMLVKEVFGWRRFANRRELAGCLRLAPTPYASGDSQIEQGISKAGNKRARALLVELAWMF